MTFRLCDVGPSLDEQDIRAVERRLGRALPKEYRAFLRQHNGGRPEPNAFPIVGLRKNPQGTIQMFLGIGAAISSSNVDWTYETMRGRLPDNLLPIARDDVGGLVCLVLSGKDEGRVYYWDYYQRASTEPAGTLYPVAATLKSFLASIGEFKFPGELLH